MLPAATPRVFVSSVVDGYTSFRQAARLGIEAAGGVPILVNEDFPALSASSRNTCLDAIDSCDILLLLIGARGGWSTPSGLLVVEEEYRRARTRNLQTLVLVQDTPQDEAARRLTAQVSDYVDGNFRTKYRDEADLEQQVKRALEPLIMVYRTPLMDPAKLQQLFDHPYRVREHASLRIALAPERQEEVIDPLRLESEAFVHELHAVGHQRSIQLFSYQRSKDQSVEHNHLVIHQASTNDRRDIVEDVRLEVHESGLVVIDSNVTGRVRRGANNGLLDIWVVATEDVESVLQTDFRFAHALYDLIDPYKRHHQFRYNTALVGRGHRNLVRNPQEQQTNSMNMSGDNKPLVAYPEPRQIARDTLGHSDDEARRVISSFVRQWR